MPTAAGYKPMTSIVAARASVLGLRESPVAMIGVSIITFWVVAALLAPWITPYDPNAQDTGALIAGPTPSIHHLLGADMLGRDILSRLLYGARVSLTVAPLAVLVAYVVGCTLGLLAGFYGGWIDTLVSRFSDVVLSFPVLILYVILIASVGPSAFNIIVAVTIASSPVIGRIVRGLTLSVRKLDYIAAAQVRGESSLYIMLVEILPSVRGPLVIDFCLRVGYTIIIIGNLGFIGLGLPPPDPDWGGMVKDTIPVMMIWPHMSILPCVAIVSLAVGFNLLADGLQEIMARE